MSVSAYLDHNASTPPRPEVVEAVVRAMAEGGNASSVHAVGRAARKRVEDAREAVAALVNADANGVFFTSGGTEANALALSGLHRRRRLVSAVEHSSVLEAGAMELIPVDGNGIVDLGALQRMLSVDSPTLVAIMLANNETGVVQPIVEIAKLVHTHGALLHVDAVQAAGRMKVDIAALGADSLSLSAHKIGGPQGVGALVLANPHQPLAPMLRGGGQESGHRAGTENVAGISGFGLAAKLANDEIESEPVRQRGLRDRFEQELRRLSSDIVIFAERVERLPNTSCFAHKAIAARRAVIALDVAGVSISAGAACAAGKQRDSHVIRAMGMKDLAGFALRASFGWNSVDADIDLFLEAFAAQIGRPAVAA